MDAAKPEVSQGRKLSAIWIIPLVAIVLGIWMVVHTYLTEGPQIEIGLVSAEGLEAGKTKVRYRNVEMGMVQKITLDDDMKGITAVVKLEREAIPMLGEDTRFWVVTARIGAGNISGLETLLSGAYIEISPASAPSKLRKFVALKEPPLTPIGAPGLRLVLLSERSPSVNSGDPVLYNGYKVGRVENLNLDPESRRIRYHIFIDAPYHRLVNSSVRFWDVSGITVNAGAKGFKLETGSLETILLGGVTFHEAPGKGPGKPVEHNTEFQLFSSYDEILNSPYEHRAYYVAEFTETLKGLFPDAPVEYRGIQVGAVERILIKDMANRIRQSGDEARGAPIPVLFYIEPGRLDLPDTEDSLDFIHEIIIRSVKNGARVAMITSNLLTGAQSLSIDFYEGPPAAEPGKFGNYTTLPTIATGLGQLEHKISTLLDKMNGLPLDTTVTSLNSALAQLNRTLDATTSLLDSDNTQAIPAELRETIEAMRAILEDDSTVEMIAELDRTLKSLRNLLEQESTVALSSQLDSTLAAAKAQLDGDSSEMYQLVGTLREVEAAARALREFLDLMEMEPESLIRGKTKYKQ